MASEKQRIVSWFYRAHLPPGPTDFASLLTSAAQEVLGKDAIAAAAYVEAAGTRMFNALIAASDHDRATGRCPLLYRGTQRRDCEFVPLLDGLDRREKQWHLRSRRRPALLREIDALNDREYEALGCVASLIAGADKALLTPPGNEGGVDFFARIKHPAFTHIFGGANTPIRIIGQCKKYSSPVTDDRIRDFTTTVRDVCHASLSMERLVPRWFRESGGPIVGWVISHSGFQSGAITRGRNQGFILSTSLDLAELFSQSRTLPGGSHVENWRWVRQKVDNYLTSPDGAN
ncbi:hypothetical protein TR70_1129 [Burkholderia pseudomallei]|nr:restriction endonuclease family protein [Burkholderia pseudomallei TSV 48]ALJ70692.1 hypothetical protein TR70_1129 [Burkholderia pseudomallei]KGR98024.1 restriction endonuclease family protein [Burkholderia pseudomallei MSHR5608]KGV03214.1 restriction endonuclease family protein [Burkholderia pseudomallei MSHR4032]KGW05756.1 restriction endonuclease family protein [Burkholderia pseudomallei TSV 25]